MTQIKIMNRWSCESLWEGEAEDVRSAVTTAVASGANLRDADLHDADLSGANLSGANLSRADLSDADLSGAKISEAGTATGDPE